jgi:hypothetical protein
MDIAYTTGSSVGVFINDGNVNFTQVEIATGIYNISDIFSADMDSDGDMDIVTTSLTYAGSSGDGYVRWYENQGNGSFVKHEIYNLHQKGITSVFVKDIDADNYNDIVVGGAWDGSIVALLKNNGDKTFTYSQVGNSDAVTGVGANDFDGDGVIDIVSTARGGDTWFKNDGSENFTTNKVTSTNGSHGGGMYSIDLDKDGDNDVLVAKYTDNLFLLHSNDGEGNFKTTCLTKFSIDGAQDIYSTDIDNDGDNDIIGVQHRELVVFINDGNQNFQEYKISYSAPNTVSSTWAIPSIHTADLDGDGVQEIIAGSKWFKLDLVSMGNEL